LEKSFFQEIPRKCTKNRLQMLLFKIAPKMWPNPIFVKSKC
jgi:hypothetical protein